MATVKTIASGHSFTNSSIPNDWIYNIYGSAVDIIISAGGLMNVYSSSGQVVPGVGSNMTVKTGGSMFVSSGGTLAGYVSLEANAVLNGFTVLNSNFWIDGVNIQNAAVMDGAEAYLYEGQKAADVTLSAGGLLVVSSGGTITSLKALEAGGRIYFYGGAVANDVILSSGVVVNGFQLASHNKDLFNLSSGTVAVGVNAYVYNGQKMTSADISAAATVNISSGGSLVSANILTGGVANVHSNGVLSGAENKGTIILSGSAWGVRNSSLLFVNNGARLYGAENGIGASMYISNGGLASDTVISGGSVTVSAGGNMSKTRMTGGSMAVGNANVTSIGVSNATVNANNNATVVSAQIGQNGRINFSSGTLADVTVENGGLLAAGGFFSFDVVIPPLVDSHFSAGVVMSGVTISSGGAVYTQIPLSAVYSKQELINLYGNYAVIQLKNNFTNTVIHSGGTLNGFTAVAKNEIPGALEFSNVVVKSGNTANLYDESVNEVVVSSGGLFNVSKGFTASAANLQVSAGGSVNITESAVLVLNGKTTLNAPGAIVINRHIVQYGASYDNLNSLFAGQYTSRYYSPVAVVSSAVISGISKSRSKDTDDWPEEGSPVDQFINPYCSSTIGFATPVNYTWYDNVDPLKALNQIKITVNPSDTSAPLDDDGNNHGSQGIIRVDFTDIDFVGLDPSKPIKMAMNEAMINNISNITITDTGYTMQQISGDDQIYQDSAHYEFAYSDTLQDAYVIAAGAADFSDIFRIVDTHGATLVESITVNGNVTAGNITYFLKKENGYLFMEMYDAAGGASVITKHSDAPTTGYTNANVSVTAQFNQDTQVGKKFYSIDYNDGTSVAETAYKVYEAVTLDKKGRVTFYGTGTDGNVTSGYVDVDNIDKLEPVFTTLSKSMLSNATITVTAVADDAAENNMYAKSGWDTAKGIQYSWTQDADDWHPYNPETKLVVDHNGTIYFKTWDLAGNYAIAPLEITEIIDPVTPVVLGYTPNTLTNGSVTIVVKFDNPANVDRNQFSKDGGVTWSDIFGKQSITYFVTEKNGRYLFRSVYNDGSVSQASDYNAAYIDFIDTDEPVKPEVTVNVRNPENPDEWIAIQPDDVVEIVKLTAAWESSDSKHEFSYDNSAWETYDDAAGLLVASNKTVYFRETDAAGNKSLPTEVIIKQIGVANAPGYSLSTTDYTSDPVLITVSKVTGTTMPMIYQYRFVDAEGNATEWTDFNYSTQKITVTSNLHVDIRAVQASNPDYSSLVSRLDVTNIDSAPPEFDSISYRRTLDEAGGGMVVTVISTDDTLGGVKETYYSLDNGVNWTKFVSTQGEDNLFTGTFTVDSSVIAAKLDADTPETLDFLVRVTDQVGKQTLSNKLPLEFPYQIFPLDIVQSVAEDVWTKEPVTVTVTAAVTDDDVIGIDTIEYSINEGSSWTNIPDLAPGTDTKTGTITLTQNGNVIFRVTDTKGNLFTYDPYTHIWIDTQAPEAAAVGGEEWTNQDVTVTIIASDALSGVQNVSYTFNGNTVDITDQMVEIETGVYSYQLPRDTFGSFSVRVVDNVGNIAATPDRNINIDKVNPSIFAMTGYEDWIKAGPMTVTITAQDLPATGSGASGVAKVEYQFKNVEADEWPSVWQEITYDVGSTDSGTFGLDSYGLFRIRLTDYAGNSEIFFDDDYVARIDTVNPVIDSLTFDPTGWTKAKVTVTVKASDNLSGMKEAYWRFTNSGVWNPIDVYTIVDGAYTGSFDVPSQGSILVKIVDNAGNETLSSAQNILIDKIYPEVESLVYSRTTSDGPMTVTVSAEDNVSAGIAKMEYSLNSTDWFKFADAQTSAGVYTKSFTLDADTAAPTFYVRVTDKAGNQKVHTENVPVLGITSDSGTGWTNTDMTLTVKAVDTAEVTTEQLEYSFDGGHSWTALTLSSSDVDPGHLTGILKVEQHENIMFKATYSGGNVYAYGYEAKIDKAGPAISYTGGETWTNEEVTVTVSADSLSGVKQAQYTHNSKPWQPVTMNVVDGVYVGTVTIDSFGPIMFRIEDNAGNVRDSVVRNIRFDKDLPVINSLTGWEKWTNADIMTISVAASDALSGVAKIEYTFGGSPWTEISYTEGTAEGFFELSEFGSFAVRVTDNAGNSTIEGHNARIDRLAPVIETVSWEPEGWTNERPITVSVTVTDPADASYPASGIAKTEYTFAGSEWEPFTGKFTVEHNGPFQVRVTDNAGNETVSKTYAIQNYDNIAPTVESISWDRNWTNKTVLVTVKAEDDYSGIKTFKYSLDGGENWNDYTGPFAVAENNTKIQVRVTDNAGNEQEDSDTVDNIDKVDPIIKSIDWDTGYTANPVTVTVETEDELSGVAKTEYSLNEGVTWTAFTDTFIMDDNGSFQVRATDNAGNVAVSEVKTVANIDRTGPAIGTPSWDTAWTHSAITVTVSGTDIGGSGVSATAYWTQNGSPWESFTLSPVDGKMTGSFDLVHNGLFAVKMIDEVGNETVSKAYMISNFDSTAPEITDVSWNTDWTNADTITVEVKTDDDYSGVAKTYYTYNSSPWTEFDGSFTALNELKSDKTQNAPFMVKVVDKAGNETLSSVYNIKTIDRLAPVIYAVDYDNTTWTAGNVLVTVTAHDEADALNKASGIDKMYYTFNGDPWKEIENGSFEIEGNGPFMVKVVDKAGNETLSAVKSVATIDRLDPVIGPVTWDTAWTNSAITITAVTSDPSDDLNKSSGVALTEYTFAGSEWTAFTDTFTVEENGPFLVRVTDNAGNVTLSQNYNIRNYDNIAPTVKSVSWNKDWTNMPVTVTVTAEDDYSGIKTFEYSLDEGVNWNDYTEPFEVAANGKIQVRVTDNAGNVTLEEDEVGNIDTVAPGIEIEWDSAFTTEPVTINVTASDDLSGVALTEYTLDEGETWTAFTDTFIMNDNGSFQVRATDNAGNVAVSEVKTVANIDRTGPAIEDPVWDTSWTHSAITVTVSGTDIGGSGVSATAYWTQNGSAWESFTLSLVDGKMTGSFDLVHNGLFAVKMIDEVGNETVSKAYMISNFDSTAPEIIGVSWNTDWTNAPADAITVNVTATDDYSGVGKMYYTFNGTPWTEFYDGSFNLNANGPFMVKVVDNAGNETLSSVYNIKTIDRLAPVIDAVDYDNTTWTAGNVLVTVTAHDEADALNKASGIDKMYYTFNGSGWNVFDGSFEIEGNGPFMVKVVDKAGNETLSAVKSVATIDRLAPEIDSVTWNHDWTNSAIEVSVTAHDEADALNKASGIGKMYYTFNGSPWTEFDGSFTLDHNGPFLVRVTDNAGNETLSRNYNILNYDNIAPEFQVSWDPAWTNMPVVVEVTASDDRSGVAKTEYKITDGDWTAFTDTFEVTENGAFQVRVTDNAGNVTISDEYEVTNIDLTKPVISPVVLDPTSWTQSDVTVTVTAEDEQSGVKSTEYALNGSDDWTPFTDTFVIGENGTFQVRATDNAGNVTISDEYEVNYIDRLAPVIDSIAWNEDWTNEPITVTVTASDDISGVALTEYTFAGSEWTAFTDTFTVEENGPFLVRVTDNAGNVAVSQNCNILNYDNVKPVVDSIGWDRGWTNDHVEVTVTASDALSGVASVEYSLNEGVSWNAYTAPFAVADNGKIQVRVTDNAGNTEFREDEVGNIDKVDPTIDSIDWDTDFTALPVTVSVIASDDLSGVAKTEYSLNEGVTWTVFTDSFEIKENGSFLVRVTDKAGNDTVSAEQTVTNIDLVDPTIDSVTWDKNWTQGPLTVTVDASDDVSGVAAIEYTFNGSPWTLAAGNTFQVTENGAFQVRVTDNVGHVTESDQYNIGNIDTVAPTVDSMTGYDVWSNTSVTVDVVVSDDLSGVAKTYYTFNGTPWTEFTGSFELTANGPFMVKVVDNAGNEGFSAVKNIKTIDRLAPVIDEISYSGEWTNGNVLVSVTAHDDSDAANKASGIGKMYYTFNGTPWTEFDGSFELTANGPFMVKVVDNAGNETLSSVYNIKTIDRLDPVIDSVTWNHDWTNQPITVSAAVSDPADDLNKSSGVAKTEYTFAGSPWTEFDGSFVLDHNGPFLVRVTDNAGNVTLSKNFNISNYDNIVPEITGISWNTDWTNAEENAITVTVTATDDYSGVGKMYYTFSGTPWTEFENGSFNLNANGPFMVKVVDNAGNETLSSVYNIKNIDRLAPVIDEVSYSGEWTNGNVLVSVTAHDQPEDAENKSSGIGKMYYTFNGTPWTEFENGSFELTANGPFMVKVVDNAGNETLSAVRNIKTIDRLAPVIDAVTWDDSWTNQPITVSVTAHDQPEDAANKSSGVALTEYTLDDGMSWSAFTGTFTVENNGPFLVRVTDNAGNVTLSQEYTISNYDDVAPTIDAVSWDPGWTKDPVTVSVTAYDDLSGVAATEYSFEGGVWTSFTDTFEVAENGVFQVRVTDNAGNVTVSGDYEVKNIDLIKPVIESVTSDTTDWTNADVTLTVNATDEGSGVALYQYLQGETWTDLAGNTYTAAKNGDYKFRVFDAVGNVSDVFTKTVGNIDKVDPTADISLSPSDWTNQDVTVTVTADDDLSKVATTEYSLNGGVSWKAYTAPFTVDTNCNILVKVTDNAGNLTIAEAAVGNIDKIDPVIDAVSWDTALTKDPVTVSVTASDVISGVAKTEYSFDGGAWTSFINTFKVYENGSFQVRVTDKAGNMITSGDYDVTNIDSQGPEITSVTWDPSSWTQSDVTVSVTAEALSGIKSTEYKIIGETGWIGFADTFVMTDNGLFQIRATDNLGNQTVSAIYDVDYIDRVNPKIDSVTWNTELTNLPVTINVTATDNLSGIASTEYSFAGGAWTSFTDTFKVYENGIFQVRATDKAGNVTVSDEYEVTNIYKDSPEITSVTLNPSSWTKEDVTVSVTAYSVIGIKSTAYTLNGGSSWNEFTNTFAMTANGQFQVRATDNLGNQTVSDTYSVNYIDRIAPTIDSVTWNTAWTNQNVTVNVAANDDLSGVAKTEYSFAGGAWTSFTDTFEVTGNGTFKVRVTDNAGNVTVSDDYEVTNIDKIAPTAVISWNPTEWTKEDVTVSISFSDEGGSGVATKEYSLNGGSWTAYTEPFTVETNGMIRAKVTDNAGNETIEEATVSNIDKIAPVINSVSQSTYAWTNADVTLTVDATDEGSGVAVYEYWNGEDWTALADNTYIAAENGDYTFRVFDGAGNVSEEVTHTVENIDKVDPVISYIGLDGSWTGPGYKARIDASDEPSGIASIQYSLNGEAWKEYSGPFTLTSNGVLSVQVFDKAGNKAVDSYEFSGLDFDGPVISSVGWTPTEPTTGFVTVTVSSEDAQSGVSGLFYSQVDSLIWTQFSGESSGAFILTSNCTFVVKAVDGKGNETVSDPYTVDNIIKAQSNSAALTGEELESWNDASMLLGSVIGDAVPVSLGDESASGSLIGELQSWISPVEEYCAADADLKKFGDSGVLSGLLAV